MKTASLHVHSSIGLTTIILLGTALAGGCAVDASREGEGAPGASEAGPGSSTESVGHTEQAISQSCVGTTFTGGYQMVFNCYQLSEYQCLTTSGCTYCNPSLGCYDYPPGCTGPGYAVVTVPGTTPVSCSTFAVSDCTNHAGCSLYPPQPLPPGYYVVNNIIYYANESALYCKLDSWAQCVAAGGKCTNSRNDVSGIPVSMTYVGDCKLPAGYFFSKGTGYYANGAGHYCAFTSWDQWVSAGGPRSGAPTFEPIPNSMTYDGICGGGSSNTGSGGTSSGGSSSSGCGSSTKVATFCPTGTSADEAAARNAVSQATAACQGCGSPGHETVSSSESNCIVYRCAP